MARRRPRSSPDQSGLPVLFIIVGCTSFALGILNPASRPEIGSSLAPAVKTEMRALADGTDLGRLAWVGLNDPSFEQTAQLVVSAHSIQRAVPRGHEVATAIRRKTGLLRVARNGVAGY
ncbi:MAG: hypothetical protein WAW96_18135 [Alphaproteobacteria bacterium]